MFPPTRQQCEVQLVVDVVVVMLACFLVVLLTLGRLAEGLRCRLRPPQADELHHRCCPPLQLMSSLLNLMLLLVELVVLPSLSHLVVELGRRWSGEDHLVSQAVVGELHVVTVLAELAHEDPRTCSRPPCCCAWGGPGLSRPCNQDTANVWA